MKPIRIYADTSVFGGCFDEQFQEASLRLFKEAREGYFSVIVSTITLDELELAPAQVRRLLNDLPEGTVERITLTSESEELRNAYIQAGVVGPASLADAEHIACASVTKADLIVSWNFKHIVNFRRIRGFHSVNISLGYPQVPIYSPWEVIEL